MAFTQTPMQSTEQNKTVSLMYNWDNRQGSGVTANGQDTLLLNALVEPVGKDYVHLLKRDGIATQFLSPAPDGPIIGAYWWDTRTLGAVYVVVYLNAAGNGSVLIYSTLGIAITATQLLAGVGTADVFIDFQPFLYQSAAKDLLIMVGNRLFKIDGTTSVVTAISVAAATSNPSNSIVYLDGYAIIHDSNNVYNSALNDPTTWPVSNFLAADSYSDNILKIARSGPYLVVFGSSSIQYFYDAANPTGTPFATNVGATKHIGYIGGISQIGDDIYFIGTVDNQDPNLYKLSGLKVEPLTSLPFARIWNARANESSALLATPYGTILKIRGHTCYYIRNASTAFSPGVTPPANLTGFSYIYDLDSQMWSKLGYRLQDFILIKSASPYVAGQGQAQTTWFTQLGDANVYSFEPFVYQDNGLPFEVRFRTKPMNFGTMRTKFGARLLLVGDETASSSFAFVSWSDNDYKTTSTPRAVDLQYSYQQLYALGSFRTRSFTVSYTDNFPMRWQSIELDYDQGSA